MEKILRLFCRRPHLFKLLTLPVIVLPLTILLLGSPIPKIVTYLIVCLLVMVIFGLFSMAAVFLLTPKLTALNKGCDPEPLADVTEFLLTCPIQGPARINVQLNQAAALREMGDYEEALRILEGIDLASTRNLSPTLKFMYANNYADLMNCMGRTKAADRWFNKSKDLYRGIPMQNGVSAYEHTMTLSKAAAYCRQENFEKAASTLNKMRGGDPRQVVEQNFILARCALAMEDPEKARKHLQYVIDNGNRLHMVTLAQDMMKNLENS